MTQLAARNGSERIQALLKLTNRLTLLIQNETALFQENKPHEAISIQDEKSKLANIYRAEIARTKKDPGRFSGASSAIKIALRTATELFHTALTANGHAVGAAKTLTEGVVKAIADEATRQRNIGSGYGPGANQANMSGSNFSIAINQTA